MKRLIIAPHVDDDVLGCGGILDKTCHVLYVGVDSHHVVSAEERWQEARAVAKRTGHRYSAFDAFTVNRYSERFPALIAAFESAISTRPDEVYIPERTSYNQDHQAVYDAAMIALRPHDTIPFVPRVLAYEQPHVMMWPTAGPHEVNYFREIDIEEKVARVELMKSQVRDYRGPDVIAALAKLRGAQARVTWAEAFRIIRWVE